LKKKKTKKITLLDYLIISSISLEKWKKKHLKGKMTVLNPTR